MSDPLSLANEIACLRVLLASLAPTEDEDERKMRSALVADATRLVAVLINAVEAERDLHPPDADDATTALHPIIARALDDAERSESDAARAV